MKITNKRGKFYTCIYMILVFGLLFILPGFPSLPAVRALGAYKAGSPAGRPERLTQAHPFDRSHTARGQDLANTWINCAAQTQIPKTECDALVAFYNSTNGANWIDHTGWLQTNTPCDWYGAYCADGHVMQLFLWDNGLSGRIPPELGSLMQLTYLVLGNNQLTGAIPPQLANLANLNYLDLPDNQLSGSIPPELGKLTNLEHLSLGQNQLTGTIPLELANLTNLDNLDLGENHLTGGIPPELGNLTNLSCLSLDSNQLTGHIPQELGNLTNLSCLILNYNQLTGTIPPQLGSLTNLSYLDLDANQLTGTIPLELANLTNLNLLYLPYNQLSGSIPGELSSLTNLVYLSLDANQLTGTIPPELGNLTNLDYLSLSQNQLTGRIPPELGNLTHLTRLSLDSNQLTGGIPPELGNLTNLDVLGLSMNQLTGSIPVEMGSLTNLTYLAIYSNWLTGGIPKQLGKLRNLQYLDLADNQLSGSIPVELGNLTSLQYLYLHNNYLTGSIPAALGNLTKLEILFLDNNRLSGEIPSSITNLSSLSMLTLSCGLTSTNPSVINFVDTLVPGWQNDICPVVSSITRGNPDPTNLPSVSFMLTFSESVKGVTADDFNLYTTGVTGAFLTGIGGSGATYTVTVNTGSGTGTIRLDVVDNDSIKNTNNQPLGGAGIGNGNFTAGQTYTVPQPSNILISGNTGAGGVTLSYFDGSGKKIVSGGGGSYTVSVRYGWYGTITPSHPCYTFDPVERPYSNLTRFQTVQDYTATYNSAPGCVLLNAMVGGTLKGSYGLPANGSVRPSYTGTDGGPVKIYSQDGTTPILASERFIYSFQNSKAYAEMIGYPDSQLTTEYWFPWYNNKSYSTQLRISNMGGNQAEVKVYAGGSEIDSFTLNPGEAKRTAYTGLDQGPLRVVSTDGVTPILVSERFIQTFQASASYSEMMGYPGDQLATEYWFPWYNNKTYSTQLRVSNMGSNSAEVKVFAGSSTTPVDTFTLGAGEAKRISYNIDNGPLHVVSTDGTTPILASERFILTFATSASYAEMMGYPGDQLFTEYCFPWYNNTSDGALSLSSQLRVSNMGGSTAQVKVYLAGTQLDSFSLDAGQGARKSYATYNNGPLCVKSTDGVTPILASERFISTYGSSASYSEMLGYSRDRLDDTYWFPWYNNISYETELRIAKP